MPDAAYTIKDVKMKLIRYRVTNFRSVMDSGWIDCDDVTTLIGVNEAGKSNLLLALWKLKPAQGGAISLLQDMPRRHYSEWREAEEKPVFIETEFELTSEVVKQVVAFSNAIAENVEIVRVSRDFDGNRFISFPNATTASGIPVASVEPIITVAAAKLATENEVGKGETGLKNRAEAVFTEITSLIASSQNAAKRIHQPTLEEVIKRFSGVTTSSLKGSTIAPLMAHAKQQLEGLKTALNKPAPHNIAEVRKLIVEKLPSFVHYSNYGNLDSEIYLPHVIQNLSRENLSGSVEAKTRTLRVLFEFVKLDPEEILELGKEVEPRQYQEITEKEIQAVAEKKKERDVLLQSASSLLTRKFRDWWKQGDYTFRFAADGSHFRIWVADKLRPDEIELENRSTGLQWFLSFYLVFLVESQEAHEGSILLLDEAGLSLHPLAQKDLTKFFEHLAATNQIINTTHSPFLLDTDHIDRAKVVYVDDDGFTITSNDLKAPQADQVRQGRSVYAVHAALNLSISEVFLQGCLSVIVEGTSDQYYLSAVKLFLIGEKLIAPYQEIGLG